MEREIFGHWRWVGSDESDEYAGVLRTTAKGSLELEILDGLPAPSDKLDLIIGRDRHNHPLSLSGLIYTARRGVVKTVFVQQMLNGIELKSVDEPIFNRVVLRFQNLLAVRNASNWTQDATQDETGFDYKIHKAEDPPTLCASTPIGKLELGVGWGTNSSHERGEYSVSDSASFLIELPTVGSLESCIDPWFRPLMDLTSFLAQCACAPIEVSVTGPDIQRHGHPDWIEVHRRWTNIEESESIYWHDALASFSDAEGEFERVILAWLQLHETADRSLAGYFVNEWDRVTFMENRFLTAAMAAEGFHRRLHGNNEPDRERVEAVTQILDSATPEIREWLELRFAHIHATSFRKRVRDLTKLAKPLIGKELIGEDFVSRVYDTRNALVHDDEENAAKVPPGGAMRVLADTLQAVMTLNIADEIGLDLDQCQERMRRKLDWIRSSQHLLKVPD